MLSSPQNQDNRQLLCGNQARREIVRVRSAFTFGALRQPLFLTYRTRNGSLRVRLSNLTPGTPVPPSHTLRSPMHMT